MKKIVEKCQLQKKNCKSEKKLFKNLREKTFKKLK